MLIGTPLLQPELIWSLIGERMAMGFNMYIGIIDDTGPFSAGMYWLIHLMAGKSFFTYQVIAYALILFQITYVNNLFIQYKAYEDNTYIPALVMTVLFHLSFDFLILSPALMGSTFIILALSQLFSQTVRHQDQPEPVFLMGLFGGIALCFHFPLVVFLPFLLTAGLIISGFNLNQLILCLTGYLLPMIICGLYYFWFDGLNEFLTGFIYSVGIVDVYPYVSFTDLAILFALPLLYTFGGFVLGFLMKRLTVNQQKQNQLIILYLIFSLLTVFVANRTTPYQLIPLIPGMAYYISQIFIYISKKKLAALLFYVFLLGVPMVGYGWTYNSLRTNRLTDYIVKSPKQYLLPDNSKVLVLGNEVSYYENTILSGPYLNYQMSLPLLKDYNDYQGLTKIYRSLSAEKPEYVIDEEGIFATLLEHLPEIAAQYKKDGLHLYKLR